MRSTARPLPRWLLSLATLLVLLLIGAGGWWLFSPVRRPIDSTPRISTLTNALPAGQAEAGLSIYTSGDQMSLRRVQVGLVLWVRYADQYLEQTIASCDQAGKGDALSSMTGIELDVADCDGKLYWLSSENGQVRVQQGEFNPNDRIVATIALPAGIERAVAPR